MGLFTYDKLVDEAGAQMTCEVKVYPLLVKRQSEVWPESQQRTTQWVEPSKAIAMIKEPDLKKIVASFAQASRRCRQQSGFLNADKPDFRPIRRRPRRRSGFA